MGVNSTTPTHAMPTILNARGVRKTFKMGDADVPVLKHVDLAVREGEFVAIEGRSGSGKSTLLHILGALDAVDDGNVEFDGTDYTRRVRVSENRFVNYIRGWMHLLVTIVLLLVAASMWILFLLSPLMSASLPLMLSIPAGIAVLAWAVTVVNLAFQFHQSEKLSADLRNKRFGFVFQFYYLLPELTVLENTLLSPMVEKSWLGFKASRKDLEQRAVELLNQFGLGHRLKHRPNQLSGGERQRVAIARALMNDPHVLFADEPTGNLDAETGRQIMDVLKKLHVERNQTIVMVTHDRALAREQADRVMVLKDGKLVTESEAPRPTPAESTALNYRTPKP